MDHCYSHKSFIGRSLKRFVSESQTKPCMLGGVIIDDSPGFIGKTDGDIIIEALVAALSTYTLWNWREAQQELVAQGITASHELLSKASLQLHEAEISSISISIQGKFPELTPIYLEAIRSSLATILNMSVRDIGISQLSGDGLNECGCGNGMDCIAVLSIRDFSKEK